MMTIIMDSDTSLRNSNLVIQIWKRKITRGPRKYRRTAALLATAIDR